jgi:hypothetical protein
MDSRWTPGGLHDKYVDSIRSPSGVYQESIRSLSGVYQEFIRSPSEFYRDYIFFTGLEGSKLLAA